MKKKIKARKPDVRAWHDLEPTKHQWDAFDKEQAFLKDITARLEVCDLVHLRRAK